MAYRKFEHKHDSSTPTLRPRPPQTIINYAVPSNHAHINRIAEGFHLESRSPAMAGAKIVECVPNFSEGQRKDVIEAIAEAIRGAAGCSLLDVDPGTSTNRTVYTFVGAPAAVVEGALSAARTAFKLIDMRKHKGKGRVLGPRNTAGQTIKKLKKVQEVVNY